MTITLNALAIDKLAITFDVPLARRDDFERMLRERGRRVGDARGYACAVTLPDPDGRGSLAFIACRTDVMRDVASYDS